MSYAKFLDDWNDEVGRLAKEEGFEIHTISREKHLSLQNLAHKRVFDRWLVEERFSELISYLHSNFDSGQGDEWLFPLSDALLNKRRPHDLKRLWRGVIAMRTKRFWDAKRPPKLNEELSKFGLKSPQYSAEEVANRKKYALDAMSALSNALTKLGEVSDADKLQVEISLFESEKRQPKKKSTDKRKIDESLFWQIISESRTESHSNPEFIQNISNRLERFSGTEVRKFQKHLLQNIEQVKSWDLWALAYIVRRGCSDDAFEYFCAWVVAQGRVAYELAKSDIQRFATEVAFDEDPQLEELMYVADHVYESNAGSPMKPVEVAPTTIRGTQWKENELSRLYPALCSRFGYDGFNDTAS